MSTESRRTKRHVGWGREAEKAFVSAMFSPSRDYDVDRNLQARNEYLLLNPRRSVPTIKIGDEVIVGFSPAAVEAALSPRARQGSPVLGLESRIGRRCHPLCEAF